MNRSGQKLREWISGKGGTVLVFALVMVALLLFNSTGLRAQTGLIRVAPDTINFGTLEIGSHADSVFTIANTGTGKLTLYNTQYSSYANNSAFIVEDLPGAGNTAVLTSGATVAIHVHFVPFHQGAQTITVEVASDDPAHSNRPNLVVLTGMAVQPNVSSQNLDFGQLRVGQQSTTVDLPIYNHGTQETIITGIRIVDSTDMSYFTTSLDTFPPWRPRQITLSISAPDSVAYIPVSFRAASIGRRRLIFEITTTEPSGRDRLTLYDTVWGEGVEPLVTVGPSIIVFDTVQISRSQPVPGPFTKSFTITNRGTATGRIALVSDRDPVHFNLQLQGQSTTNVDIPVGASVSGTITFTVTESGDFTDTILVANDTRYTLYGDSVATYSPRIIVHAHVRTGRIDSVSIAFDTVTDCRTTPVRQLVISNPYPVGIHFDTIIFAGGADGFSFGGTAFQYPINIAANSSYPLYLQYTFPADSLNGDQLLDLVLMRRRGGEEPPLEQTMTATVTRKQRVLTLQAQLPKFVSSAGDIAPLKLPIYVRGPRDQVPELDSWTLELEFSNDLFVPVGIDTRGSLSIPRDTRDPVTYSWDQTTRTYTITAKNVQVSDPARLGNDLLLNVLLRAYLTTDTIVTVTPRFTFESHPCAYNLQPFTLQIPYADDCGEVTIRDFMRTKRLAFDVVRARLDPYPQRNGNQVAVDYISDRPVILRSYLSTLDGSRVGRVIEQTAPNDTKGRFFVPIAGNVASGVLFLTIEAFDPVDHRLLQRTGQPVLDLK